jgi:hypothetical protein
VPSRRRRNWRPRITVAFVFVLCAPYHLGVYATRKLHRSCPKSDASPDHPTSTLPSASRHLGEPAGSASERGDPSRPSPQAWRRTRTAPRVCENTGSTVARPRKSVGRVSRGRAGDGGGTAHLQDDVPERVDLALHRMQRTHRRLVDAHLRCSPSRGSDSCLGTLPGLVRMQDDAVRKVVQDCVAGGVDAHVTLHSGRIRDQWKRGRDLDLRLADRSGGHQHPQDTARRR